MMGEMKNPKLWLGIVAVLGMSGQAFAQGTTPTTDPATTGGEGQPAGDQQSVQELKSSTTVTTGDTTTTTTTTTASDVEMPAQPVEGQRAEEVKSEEDMTDHERVVGAWGFGLLGNATPTYITGVDGSFNYSLATLNVPIIGVRHWLSKSFGLQFGIGLGQSSSTRKDNIIGRFNVDEQTLWGLAFHAGAPIALYSDRHYKFLVIPELNVAYASGRKVDNQNIPGDDGTDISSWLLSAGLKVGAEIQFGFIGIPMLSLQATVGAALSYRYHSFNTLVAGQDTTFARWAINAETANYNNPWDVFRGSIAAIYYFK